jgi:hypothetical protein
MKELHKTLIFVAVALVLTGAAAFRPSGRTATDAVFNDQGKPFFPDFKDPFVCTDLEVVDYDSATATASRFQVKLKDGKWVIPSHYNYPADAKDRLGKTAAGVMDLTRDTIRSDSVEDHEKLGVIDPLDTKNTSLKGRGKRVTLRDVSDKTLADFIIGNEVDKESVKKRETNTQRYVRVPGQKPTYGVNMKVDLSTKFADWIETNLLKLDSFKVRRVVFNSTKVDPEQGKIIPGEVMELSRKDSSGPWTLSGEIPEGQELNTEKINDLTTALSDLKISGVRPKPAGLTRDLKTGEKGISMTQQALLSLQSKGFYPTRDGQLLSNQGDVMVATEEGVVYTLRFGEVFFGSGEELSAGSDESAEKEKGKAETKKDAKKTEGATESRYLMVTASFDPTLIPEPKPEPEPPLTIPDDPFQLAPDDPKRIAEEKADKEKADRKKADQDKKIADGKKRVDELSDRFASWYYVTPGTSFRSIALDRAALLKAKTAPASTSGTTPGSAPGLPNLNLNLPHP